MANYCWGGQGPHRAVAPGEKGKDRQRERERDRRSLVTRDFIPSGIENQEDPRKDGHKVGYYHHHYKAQIKK